jgi:spore coat protein U-like protein
MEDILNQIAVDLFSVIVITSTPNPSDPINFNTYKAIEESVNFTSAIVVTLVVALDYNIE